jgi:AraC-like DNA-binding protein
MQRWLASEGRPSISEIESLRAMGQLLRDAASHARVKVMLSAVGKQRQQPLACLKELHEAEAIFRASSLELESRIARCEAGGHLQESLCAAEALQLLQASNGPGTGDEFGLLTAERAKTALCWLDLGDAERAQGLALEALRALDAKDVAPEPLTLQRARIHAVDVLIACLLATYRRLECGLTDSILLPDTAAKHDPTGRSNHAAWFSAARSAVLGRVAVDHASQLALLAAIEEPDAASLTMAQGLVSRLSELKDPPPAAWLRLAVCLRLLERPVLAAHCAREAWSAAGTVGSLRWQRLALLELAFVQSDVGKDGLADVWARLRVLERQVRHLALQYQRLRSSSVTDPSRSGHETGVVASRQRALHVRAALKLIQASAKEAWSVAGLAQRCGVSRRTLEQAFRQEAGITVSEAIRKARTDRALQLLRNTDLPVKRVALDSGYSSASALCREIKRHTGLSPLMLRVRERTGQGRS